MEIHQALVDLYRFAMSTQGGSAEEATVRRAHQIASQGTGCTLTLHRLRAANTEMPGTPMAVPLAARDRNLKNRYAAVATFATSDARVILRVASDNTQEREIMQLTSDQQEQCCYVLVRLGEAEGPYLTDADGVVVMPMDGIRRETSELCTVAFPRWSVILRENDMEELLRTGALRFQIQGKTRLRITLDSIGLKSHTLILSALAVDVTHLVVQSTNDVRIIGLTGLKDVKAITHLAAGSRLLLF